MAQKIMQFGNLSGEEGVLVAVIGLAVRDATDPRAPAEERADAWRYLAGPDYREHLGLLGLPAEWLPAAIEEAAEHAAT